MVDPAIPVQPEHEGPVADPHKKVADMIYTSRFVDTSSREYVTFNPAEILGAAPTTPQQSAQPEPEGPADDAHSIDLVVSLSPYKVAELKRKLGLQDVPTHQLTVGDDSPSGQHNAHLRLAMSELGQTLVGLGECIVDLGTASLQGVRDDNRAKLGGIAAGLRRAAWRIQHGTMTGWAEMEERMTKPDHSEELFNLLEKIGYTVFGAIDECSEPSALSALTAIGQTALDGRLLLHPKAKSMG